MPACMLKNNAAFSVIALYLAIEQCKLWINRG